MIKPIETRDSKESGCCAIEWIDWTRSIDWWLIDEKIQWTGSFVRWKKNRQLQIAKVECENWLKNNWLVAVKLLVWSPKRIDQRFEQFDKENLPKKPDVSILIGLIRSNPLSHIGRRIHLAFVNVPSDVWSCGTISKTKSK